MNEWLLISGPMRTSKTPNLIHNLLILKLLKPCASKMSRLQHLLPIREDNNKKDALQ